MSIIATLIIIPKNVFYAGLDFSVQFGSVTSDSIKSTNSTDSPKSPLMADQTTLTDFVRFRCRNVLVLKPENDPEADRKPIEKDLRIYMRYNRGIEALLPIKPVLGTSKIKTLDVLANTFSITFNKGASAGGTQQRQVIM